MESPVYLKQDAKNIRERLERMGIAAGVSLLLAGAMSICLLLMLMGAFANEAVARRHQNPAHPEQPAYYRVP